ncbi:MAG TPA: GNAT family N-acetyltransferase [Vineibacter sp.]|nr:GNAT family N-acetyltransferase [Vineibacter sp.]
MRIRPLADRPDLLATVARWEFDAWGYLSPGTTLQDRIEDVRAAMRVDRVPMAFVALDDAGTAIGTASLIEDDLPGDARNPWLANVYVAPSARRSGIASRLVGSVERQAARFGYRRLYLFTATVPGLYARLGWHTLEERDYRGEQITVMAKDLPVG